MPVSDGRGHHNDSSSEQPRLFSEDRRLLLQRRQSLPVLEEEDPDWIRVGRLSDFKVLNTFHIAPSHNSP